MSGSAPGPTRTRPAAAPACVVNPGVPGCEAGPHPPDRLIRPVLRPEDEGKYLAVAVESGDFEIDADDYAATGRLLARRPGARLWLMRTGPSAAYRTRKKN